MFIDELDPPIKTLVAHYREQHPKVTYLELIQFTRAEGEALRARDSSTQQNATRALRLQTGSSSICIGASDNPNLGYDKVQGIHQDGVLIPTTDLPSTTEGTFPTALAETPVDPTM